MAYNMTIQTISKEDKNVTVELSADDLVMICNALYLHSKEQDLQSKDTYIFNYMECLKRSGW